MHNVSRGFNSLIAPVQMQKKHSRYFHGLYLLQKKELNMPQRNCSTLVLAVRVEVGLSLEVDPSVHT